MPYYQYDLDTNTLGPKVNYTASSNEQSNGDGSFCWVASRNRMWVRAIRNGDGFPMVWEFNSGMTATTQLFSNGAFGGTYGSFSGSPLLFNPRAFGGNGGVFAGSPSVHVIETVPDTTLVVHTNTTGAPSDVATRGFDWPHDGHVAVDPENDGWLYMNLRDGFMWQLSSGAAGAGNSGTWTQKAQLPQTIRDRWTAGFSDYILISLEVYGCIWIIGTNYGQTDRAWLYKP